MHALNEYNWEPNASEIERVALFSQPISGGGLLTHIREESERIWKNLKNSTEKSFECSEKIATMDRWVDAAATIVIGQQDRPLWSY